jgi:hypothetical protein
MTEITGEQIEEEFPGWKTWCGVDRLWHARLGDGMPPVVVHGEDPADLRDQIKVKLSRMEEGRWRNGK